MALALHLSLRFSVCVRIPNFGFVRDWQPFQVPANLRCGSEDRVRTQSEQNCFSKELKCSFEERKSFKNAKPIIIKQLLQVKAFYLKITFRTNFYYSIFYYLRICLFTFSDPPQIVVQSTGNLILKFNLFFSLFLSFS